MEAYCVKLWWCLCYVSWLMLLHIIRFHNTALHFTGLETKGSVKQFELLKMGVNTPETCWE
jgi:hypothetical protein